MSGENEIFPYAQAIVRSLKTVGNDLDPGLALGGLAVAAAILLSARGWTRTEFIELLDKAIERHRAASN